jgi:exopolysaccharide biosynthesis polyprenyl glycosylphosphotransferase
MLPWLPVARRIGQKRESVLNRMLGLTPDLQSVTHISILKKEPSGLGMLPQDLFIRFLCLERKRTERSGRRFVLLLVDSGTLLKSVKTTGLPNLMLAITQATRDTDLIGWYKEGEIIGVIFTEVGSAEDKVVVHALSTKVTDSLYRVLSIKEINEIRLSFHVFPEDWHDHDQDGPVKATLQMALAREIIQKKASLGLKRLMDIIGSILGLLLCLPVFVVIALAIKLNSSGPVFFRQVRLGQHGKKFTFLKFRSMRVNSDHQIHEEYVKRFILGASTIEQATANQQNLYKLTADPRITRIGRFLRSTSLDELPQFFNVLWGDMSLVGPRPPVIYEFERYNLWHKQRLLPVKPGITGLWQVRGRSRVTFDEMVRLDIRYARCWSLWLDIKILAQTPRAVFSGNGAY